MARKQTIDAILGLFKKLGGNTNDVLGTKTNVNFLGKGKSPELMLDMDINAEALGVLPRSKAVEELTSSVGYAVSGKLNDIQANQLLKNMQTMDSVYFPPAAPANITDLQTGIRNLDQEGLMSLRAEEKLADDVVKNVSEAEYNLRSNFPKASDQDIKDMLRLNIDNIDDLPPPGSRGGPDDIAAPFASAEETISNLREMPTKRASAREFLVEALKEDDVAKGGNTFSNFVTKEDVKYITEGGGGVAGDPLVLVEKYFGPRIAEMVPTNASSEEIAIFTKRVLNNVVDAAGNRPDSPRFDRFTARFIDEVQDFAKGGLAKILEV